LLDKKLFESVRLNDELGELMRLAYPELDTFFAVENQAVLNSLFDNLDDEIEFINSVKYKLLVKIPIIFRTEETQNFLDIQGKIHEYDFPAPKIQMSLSEVQPPSSTQNLLALSDRSIIRLLNFYIEDQSHKEQNRMGWDRTLVPALREASCMDPNRFIQRVLYSKDPYLSIEYIPTLVEGIATHLRCRFGNLSYSEYNPLKPLPNGINLAKDLLKILEQYSIFRIGGDASSEALLACCSVLIDNECADRLSLQLFWLYETHINEINQTYSNGDELIGKMINSVCGVVAEAAVCLHNRLLELNLNIPELLTCLIEKLVKDKRDYVRVAILRHLPFIIYKQPTRGWELLSDIFKRSETLLWQYTEQCLYNNYKHNFGMISPYIERLFREGMKEAGDTWGRISALSVLAGYIDADQLFEQLQLVPDCESGWEGISQVFT
jgi:hypothetical protein